MGRRGGHAHGRRWWSAAISLFVLAFVVTSLVGFGGPAEWWARVTLPADGLHAVARVTSTSPSDHERCRFSFTVDDRAASGSDTCPGDVRVGDHLPIVYSPHEASVATVRSPWSLAGYAIAVPLIVALFAVAVLHALGRVIGPVRRAR